MEWNEVNFSVSSIPQEEIKSHNSSVVMESPDEDEPEVADTWEKCKEMIEWESQEFKESKLVKIRMQIEAL